MAAPPSKVLWQALQYLGAFDGPGGGSSGWVAVYGGPVPPDGDRYVGVMDTGAYTRGRIERTGEVIRKPTVQLSVRSADYADGFARGQYVTSVVSGIGALRGDFPTGGPLPVLLGDGEAWAIQSVTLMTELMLVGRTEDRRLNVFTANFAASLKRLADPSDKDRLWPVGGYR